MNGARRGKPLSPREAEVMGALCMGERPYEVGERIGLSHTTIDSVLLNVRIKYGVRTTYAAIYQFVKEGISE